MNEDDIIEDSYITVTKDLLDEGHNAIKIANTLTALAHNLYSELLSTEEHTELMKKLYQQQDKEPTDKFITIN